ncbi:MAG: hypothetical protein A2W05_08215 [Candidatus Schekmanbacteria bacterium RBG_16_38_10]|uniref:LysM domain-containing protein n=1 Tax=Candidatus Schekmanbacteria bacterium RBG_16_38_10 TaxID=1817879 RepID=A0A1F7RS58_9BACT|nr:MAG: hypothetical protein A2W05_08215 [Candidatus Schekmanbacteria bacterium RBG_16_38_10]
MGFKKSLLIILAVFFIAGCSYPFINNEISPPQFSQNDKLYQPRTEYVPRKPPIQIIKEAPQQDISNSQILTKELGDLFTQAKKFYNSGVDFSNIGDWDQAEDEFENSLEYLQSSPLADKYPDEINKFYNILAEDILAALAKKEESAGKLKESILSAKIPHKPEEEMTIKEKVELDLKKNIFDVPIEVNQKVIDYVEFFSIEKKESMEKWLGRAMLYLPTLQRIFKEKGLPNDLIYLPLIESAFNPDAYSYAKACGLWQFIPGTAKKYGLKIDWWVDERRDFEKATHAAAKYLQNLNEMFNDWRLALAAYNAGEGRIARAIEAQKTSNFWELNLHPQTMNYVPAYMASVIIAKNPKRYGLDVTYESPLDYDTVTITKSVDLKTISECAGTTRGIIKKLNPELRSWATPPKNKSYELRIPAGAKDKFAVEIANAKVAEKSRVAWVNYRVKKNETLSTVARKFNISVNTLMEANSMSNANKISKGQKIIVPNYYERLASASSGSDSGSESKNTKLSFYTVKSGDTLGEIAKTHKVSVNSIKKWNKLKRASFLKPNQKLKIYSSKEADIKVATNKTVKSENTSENLKEIIYIVKKGDTLWNIAKSYKISANDIIATNNISRKNAITPGDRLKLKVQQEL